jgi:hypothetical protein
MASGGKNVWWWGGGVGDIHVEGKEGGGKNGRRVVGTGLEPAGMREMQVAAWLHHVASMRQGRRCLLLVGPCYSAGGGLLALIKRLFHAPTCRVNNHVFTLSTNPVSQF